LSAFFETRHLKIKSEHILFSIVIDGIFFLRKGFFCPSRRGLFAWARAVRAPQFQFTRL
jgi:hypothetical protein